MLRQLCLTETKLCELRELLSNTLSRHLITKQDLPSLVSKLNFAARVVFERPDIPERCHQCYEDTSPHYQSRLTKQLHADLLWWANFLNAFNGKTYFVDSEPVSSEASVVGTFRVTGFTLTGQLVIAIYKETFAVLLALIRWKHELHDKCIFVYSDNCTTISVLNKGTCCNSQVMPWLRSIFWLSATYNFRITALRLSYHPRPTQCRHYLVPFNDPALSHALSDLFSGNDSCQAHFSTSVFFSPTAGAVHAQEQLLQEELRQYPSHAFAKSTTATYKSHLGAYLRSCLFFGYRPVPFRYILFMLGMQE